MSLMLFRIDIRYFWCYLVLFLFICVKKYIIIRFIVKGRFFKIECSWLRGGNLNSFGNKIVDDKGGFFCLYLNVIFIVGVIRL